MLRSEARATAPVLRHSGHRVTVYHDGNPVLADTSGLGLAHALRRDERTTDRERSPSAVFDARIW